MDVAEFILDAFEQPYFYVGVVFCWFLSIFVRTWKEGNKRERRRYQINEAKIIDELLAQADLGEKLSVETIFALPERVKNPEPPRYRAWKCLVYWMAAKYATYDYGIETLQATHRLAKMLFGERSMTYSKFLAVEEVLDRSTKYFLDKRQGLYQNRATEDFVELFDMVDLMIDSMYADNY